MKKILLLVFSGFIVSALNAQDVQIKGKQFEITSQRQINSDVGYYRLKEKSNHKAGNHSYIKTNGDFHKTVFTESELKSFFAKGTISSFGKISELRVSKKRKVKYVNKGRVSVLFAINKGQLIVLEYAGDVKVLFRDNGNGPSTGRIKCGRGCKKQLDECDKEFGPQGDDSDDPCFMEFIGCINACDDAFPIGISSSSYIFNLSSLSVKF